MHLEPAAEGMGRMLMVSTIHRKLQLHCVFSKKHWRGRGGGTGVIWSTLEARKIPNGPIASQCHLEAPIIQNEHLVVKAEVQHCLEKPLLTWNDFDSQVTSWCNTTKQLCVESAYRTSYKSFAFPVHLLLLLWFQSCFCSLRHAQERICRVSPPPLVGSVGMTGAFDIPNIYAWTSSC